MEAKYDGQSLQEAKIRGLVYTLCGIWATGVTTASHTKTTKGFFFFFFSKKKKKNMQ